MNWNELHHFARAFRGDATGVASLIPTSTHAAHELAAELARDPRPKQILEAGPGTGSVTAEIIAVMGAQDQLTLVELNHEFVQFLRERIASDPAFAHVRGRIVVLEMSITDLDADARFDYIVSALPFSNFPPALVGQILDTFARALGGGGVLSFIEYAGGRRAKLAIARVSRNTAALDKITEVERIVAMRAAQHQFRRDTVWRNLPPAWIRHWRFAPAQAVEAARLSARIRANHVLGLDTDALPFALGAGALALVLRKHAPVVALGSALAGAAAALFLRDPQRQIDLTAGAAISACDGRVTHISRVQDARFGSGPWLRIVCFLSISDVHINRAPVAGRVVDVLHEMGGHAPAMQAAAEHNASVYTVIESADGDTVVLAQRVGAVARRIVNRCVPGMLLARGEKIGLIRFGSRTDVYLPADRYSAAVSIGDRVIAGETVLALRAGN